MKRGLAGVVLAAFAVLTSASFFGAVSTAAAAETHQIPIARYAYVPATMTVHVGDVVTWTNQDEASHDVAGGTFRSPMLATGQSWSFTFTQPGTFDYICSVHPDMRAQIVVLAHETTAAPPPPPVQQQPVVQQPGPTTTTTTSVAPPTTTSTSAVAAVAAPQPTSPALPPMLLLAGLVAAVTTLCLLMIGSRPDRT